MRTAKLALASFMLAFTCAAQAQDRVDLSVSGGGIFGKGVSQSTSAVTLSPRYSGFFLGSVRYHFTHLHAVEVNIGHAATSQVYTLPPDIFKVDASVLEFSADYVLTPHQSEKLKPFLFAGLGALRWSPGNQYIDLVLSPFGANSQNSLAFLYGGGIDYHLWRRVYLRAQYRGLLYRAPDFGVSALFISAKDHMAEPTAGLVIKF